MRTFLWNISKFRLKSIAPTSGCTHYSRLNRNLNISAPLYVKLHVERENIYAYGIMRDRGYAIPLDVYKETVLSEKDFRHMFEDNSLKNNPTKLFDYFSKLGKYCTENNLCISNKIFDDFVDNITDNIKHATDLQLESLFYYLKNFPPTESVKTRNFIEIWAALDDECLNRSQNWSNDVKLKFVTLFYMINISKASEFSFKTLQRLANKAIKLTPSQFVQTLFFVGVHRKSPDDMHNFEVQLSSLFDEFSLDDLAVISMGFFKSKTPIRDTTIISRIIDKIIMESKTVHEVSLAALLKIIRYSMKIVRDDRIYNLIDSLKHEVSRLSVMCNVHVALLGTATLTMHKECITAIANKLISNISECRLKDLERMTLTLGIFSYIPETKDCFIEKVMAELRNPDRNLEIDNHGRSFALCVYFLSLLNYYPTDLISKVLSKEFIHKTYGKHPFNYGREVLTINNSAKIFCKDQNITFLTDKEAIIMAKKHTDFMPEENYPKQYNVAEKMILDTMRVLKDHRGGDQFVTGAHVLTHHQRGDIIICNSPDGAPIPVAETFNNSNFGLLHQAPDDNNLWIALVIGARNAYINKDNTPTGPFLTKIRELKALGFHPALVLWHEYTILKTKEEKINYLNNLISTAVNKL